MPYIWDWKALRHCGMKLTAYLLRGSFQQDRARSPVWQAAEGRRAATSMDRYLQKVSLTAGREKDGPYPTRLYTRTDGVTPLPAVQPLDPVHGIYAG